MLTNESLSPRQAKFVQEYLVDGCGAKAAVRAGIAPSGAHVWASRTLRNAKVSEALQARQKADATRLKIAREDVLASLLEAAEMARQTQDAAALISAAREIGRLQGYYAPQAVKIDVALDGHADMARMQAMSDAELLAVIEAGRAGD